MDTSVGWRKFLKSFLPVFAISAVLPVFLFLALRPSSLRFVSRADTEAVLRVWVEPASVVVDRGDKASMRVVAEVEGDVLVPSVTVELIGERGIGISQSEITYSQPFSGKVVLGNFEAYSKTAGEFRVVVASDGVSTGLTQELEIITGAAEVIVK